VIENWDVDRRHLITRLAEIRLCSADAGSKLTFQTDHFVRDLQLLSPITLCLR